MTPPTEPHLPHSPREAVDAVREDARFGLAFLRQRWRRLLLAFAGLLLPLWAFGELADEVHEAELIPFDAPILLFARQVARQGFDTCFLLFSKLGYEWGVVPFDIALVLVLAAMRKVREGLFAGIALGGSALLNLGAKQFFARERPSLWESIAPESTFSFPSGHAMGSMTLAATALFLAWNTRWRWPVAITGGIFVFCVGLSRVHLGVHYPSDILGGWCAALAWVTGVHVLLFRRRWSPSAAAKP